MEKHCESEKRFGKEGNGEPGSDDFVLDAFLLRMREILQVGGSGARREIVRTTLELQRLLAE
jgi:hypothetical protein